MATLAEFALPRDAFPFGVVFEEFPEATVELERVVPTPDAVRQYFWVENVPSDAIVEFLESQTDVAEVVPVVRLDDRTLFRYRNDRRDSAVLQALFDSGATLLSAMGTRSGWQVHVRGDTQHAVATFDEECRGAGVQPTLRDLSPSPDPPQNEQLTVTDAQREALLLAYEKGYYAEPRETDLAELAAEVGISRQAFARRLTRGYRTLIELHLSVEAGDEHVS